MLGAVACFLAFFYVFAFYRGADLRACGRGSVHDAAYDLGVAHQLRGDIGTNGLPVRLFAPSEVLVLTLRPG